MADLGKPTEKVRFEPQSEPVPTRVEPMPVESPDLVPVGA